MTNTPLQNSLTDLPKLVRGCWFDAGWEFYAPTVLYQGIYAYSPNGGNSGEIERLFQNKAIDICIDREAGKESPELLGFFESDLGEFKWRRWSPKGFKRRKAIHVEFQVEWFWKGGEVMFDYTKKEIK